MTVSVRARDMLGAVLVGGLLVGGAGAATAAGTSTLASAADASPQRAHGSLKVYDDEGCTKGPRGRVVGTFSVGGRHFQPDQAFTLAFRSQVRGDAALTVSGTTSDKGRFCLGPQTLPAGVFLVSYLDESGKTRGSRLFTVLPTKGEPSVPPVTPEPSTPPAKPEPSTPPAKPEPSTPPAKPEPSTPPAKPEPSTPPPSSPPARPQPSSPPARPQPFVPAKPTRTSQPQAAAPSSSAPAVTDHRTALAAAGRTPRSSASPGPTRTSAPAPTPRAAAVLGDGLTTPRDSAPGDVEETLVAVPVGLAEHDLGGGANPWILILATLGLGGATAWGVVVVARREG